MGFKGIPGAIEKPFTDAGAWLQKLPNNMYEWGKNGMEGLGKGVEAGVPGLSKVLGDISDLFPKSPPKAGPLSKVTPAGMEAWMKQISTSAIKGLGPLSSVFTNNTPFTGFKSLSVPSGTTSTNSNTPSELHLTVDLSGIPKNINPETAKMMAETAGAKAGSTLASQLASKGININQIYRS